MCITKEPIQLDRFFSFTPDPACGALASFIGLVRNHDHDRRVRSLYYDCYRPMAEKMLKKLAAEAGQKWEVHEIRLQHRVGPLEIGDVAVAIAVSAAHRDEAFQACRFLIERVKKEVPIWKKQIYADGSGEWVACEHFHEVVG